MCFSASASFGAGIVLVAIGAASIKKKQNSSHVMFAAIPLIFGIQQISEGFLWLSLTHSGWNFLQRPMTYVFLFFAQIVWPFWVPYSILKLEKDKKRKKIERVLTILGATISVYLAYCLISYHVEAKILGLHITYLQNYPTSLSLFGGALYMIVTIIPPFFSGIKHMWSLGTAILISYVMTAIFYEGYIVSVWCFFASVISIAVVVIMHEIKKSYVRSLSFQSL
ncbi:DUF6629 family protein [Aurantibacillus circumpalustris]|uniref:DUF6629 family protein n=1 Tax=Aurantibacillus circumpalustris TaxID=3036359 RepID=UPI00295BC5CD|nr:DUF6629 family protein [Aurantibacillus circumpalustris]